MAESTTIRRRVGHKARRERPERGQGKANTAETRRARLLWLVLDLTFPLEACLLRETHLPSYNAFLEKTGSGAPIQDIYLALVKVSGGNLVSKSNCAIQPGSAKSPPRISHSEACTFWVSRILGGILRSLFRFSFYRSLRQSRKLSTNEWLC